MNHLYMRSFHKYSSCQDIGRKRVEFLVFSILFHSQELRIYQRWFTVSLEDNETNLFITVQLWFQSQGKS